MIFLGVFAIAMFVLLIGVHLLFVDIAIMALGFLIGVVAELTVIVYLGHRKYRRSQRIAQIIRNSQYGKMDARSAYPSSFTTDSDEDIKP